MTAFYFKLNQLSYAYADGTKALSDLTLHIPKGKKIAILGHNGAGKSTLFQHLNGILKPTTGTILFEGNRLEYNRKALKALRQKSALFSKMQIISFFWDRQARYSIWPIESRLVS